MSADAWVTAALLVGMLAVLMADRFSPMMVMAATVVGLMATDVIDEDQAFGGFGNSAPITVAALYVLAGAIDVTGALETVTSRALTDRSDESDTKVLARLLIPITAMSAFVANTPLVSVLVPRVMAWCRRTGRAPGRYLMPLSYAAVLGGVITVMGTSTNLVISSLVEESGREPLRLFEVTPVGLAVALVGLVVVIALAPRLVPIRSNPADLAGDTQRDFTVEWIVQPGSPLVGATVAESGLRHLDGVFLVAAERADRTTVEVSPDLSLAEGDRLVFVGDISRVLDLQRVGGLQLAEEPHFASITQGPGRRVFEAVVSNVSPIAGATLPELDFRRRYGAVVLAVHRAGDQIHDKPGAVRFRPGDVLVLLAPPEWDRRWKGRDDFLVIAGSSTEPPKRKSRARFVEVVTLAVIATSALEVLSLQEAAIYAAVLLIVTGTITVPEARAAIKLEIIAIMALSVALGIAADTSGLAAELAQLMTDALGRYGDVGLIAGVLLATMLATELLSNNAAAALMVPLALGVSESAGVDERAMILTVLIGASCSFITPIGYQTNTMVFGLGGYRFGDFTRLGAPLTVAVVTTSLITIPLFT